MNLAALCCILRLLLDVLNTCILQLDLHNPIHCVALGVTGTAAAIIITYFHSPPAVLRYCDTLQEQARASLASITEENTKPEEGVPSLVEIRTTLDKLDETKYNIERAIRRVRTRYIPARLVHIVPHAWPALRLIKGYRAVLQDLKFISDCNHLKSADNPAGDSAGRAPAMIGTIQVVVDTLSTVIHQT